MTRVGGNTPIPVDVRVVTATHRDLLEEVEAPEDWRAAFELDDDDMLDPDLPIHPEDWGSPLNSIEPDAMYGVEDL